MSMVMVVTAMHLRCTYPGRRSRRGQRFEFMPLRIDDNLTIPLFAVVTPCSSEPSFTGWRDGPVTRRRACHPSREHAHGRSGGSVLPYPGPRPQLKRRLPWTSMPDALERDVQAL